MEVKDLITAKTIFPSLKGREKKHVLQDLALSAAKVLGLGETEVFEAVLRRERLGSTGVGRGIAIPHCRLALVNSVVCFFARLDVAIPYESPDGEPVDLIFLIIAPEEAGADHLKALACISRTMRDEALCKKLRTVRNVPGLYALLTDSAARPAA